MIDYSIAIMSTTPGTKKNEITETKAYGTAQVREVLDINKFAKHIKEVNVRWCPGDKFKDLRADAEFNLVPTRLQQAAQKKVITNQETIQGME